MRLAHTPERAVAIMDGSTLRASGYLIASGVVLTCQHTFERQGQWRVLRWDETTVELDLDRTLLWPEVDIALLFARQVDDLPPVEMGAVDPLFPDPLPFQMYGWPLWGSEVWDGVRREGGRMIRGSIEPSDVSPDGNLVLQPTRWGASDHRKTSDWTGMSGAAVFSLDRLIGVQRRQVDVLRPDSVEARPVAPLWVDSDFARVMDEHGVRLDHEWLRSGARARGRRLEIHGPTEVPLFTVTDFQVRSDRWDRLTWRTTGVGDPTPRDRSPLRPLESIAIIPTDSSWLGRPGRLIVEAASDVVEGESALTTHEFQVTAPDPVAIAVLYELGMWFLDHARAGGPPPENIRAAAAGAAAADLLEQALTVADPSPIADSASLGLGAMRESLTTAEGLARRRLSDESSPVDAEIRKEDKYTYHRAYGPRQALRQLAVGEFSRTNPFWVQSLRLLGYDGIEAVDSYLRPRARDLEPQPGSFEALVMQLLLEEEVIDVRSRDFEYTKGQLNDLVNTLIIDGLANWQEGSARLLSPTAAGRLWLRDRLRDIAG